jgi:hypothetical protein
MTNANFISHQFSNLCLYLCGMGINLKLHPVPGFRCGQSRLSLSTFVYSLSWMQYFSLFFRLLALPLFVTGTSFVFAFEVDRERSPSM